MQYTMICCFTNWLHFIPPSRRADIDIMVTSFSSLCVASRGFAYGYVTQAYGASNVSKKAWSSFLIFFHFFPWIVTTFRGRPPHPTSLPPGWLLGIPLYPPPPPPFCPLVQILVADYDPWDRRKIRLIESNAKCRYLKKLTCKGTLRQVFYLSEAPFPPMTPYSPPAYTLYTCKQYSYSHRERVGGGGGVESNPVRSLKGHYKPGRKYQHDWLYLQTINSIEHQ